MLVLSRKIGEVIIIGDNIRITVVDVGQGRVKIGVQAPNDISVNREEIHDKKTLEKTHAGSEEAIPVLSGLHNRISSQVPEPTTVGPRPQSKPLNFRMKSR